mgnify:CR=1 FL=1
MLVYLLLDKKPIFKASRLAEAVVGIFYFWGRVPSQFAENLRFPF